MTPVIGPFDHEENGAFLKGEINLARCENFDLVGPQNLKKEFRTISWRVRRSD